MARGIDCTKIIYVTIAGQREIVHLGSFTITAYTFTCSHGDYEGGDGHAYSFLDDRGVRYHGPLSAIQMVQVSG
jgi:hypothetical protein